MKLADFAKGKYITAALVIAFSFLIVHMVYGAAADPGTDANPLVTQDYVDGKIAELSNRLDSLAARLEGSQAQEGAFKAVEIKAGKQVIAGAGTEMILRSGKATAIASASGGVADVTAGKDIATGGGILFNHLLLFSKDDGRGLKILQDSWVLIKGAYTVK
ncbi:MAG: hypothetical protein QHH06_15395 [Clostridiales bacterium]|jgi:hypothetical protein|nr:hypothetical protein [Eubacteriales bacterium]MDH7567820.1 hypothetical protein [Clostridiales bacterium]